MHSQDTIANALSLIEKELDVVRTEVDDVHDYMEMTMPLHEALVDIVKQPNERAQIVLRDIIAYVEVAQDMGTDSMHVLNKMCKNGLGIEL